MAIIRKADDMQTLNVQTVESTDKYIIGKYDLEILTLPRMYVKGVRVIRKHYYYHYNSAGRLCKYY